MRHVLVAGLLIGCCALVLTPSGTPVAAQAKGWTPTIEALAAPTMANTTEPQLTSRDGRTVLSWLELQGPRTTLKFAERTAAGWSEVRTVAEGNDFMVNSADVPSVVLLADGTVVAHWLQQDGPDPESYKLRLAWSKDGGRMWSDPLSPHHDKVQTQHGFGSLFQVPGGGLGLVWLDGRAIRPDAPEGVGNMALRATTFGTDGRQRVESVVDSRVCECCPTAAADTSDGVIVAYRNRSASEIRDIYVTRLVAGRWTPPRAVHNDGWRVKGCPVNGPAISARDRTVVVAWFTEKAGQGHAFAAFSRDGGQTFGSPIRLDDQSALGRVGVQLLPDGSAVATWVEFGQPNSQFRARWIDASGTEGPTVRVADSTGTRYPRLAQSGNELLFAWTETQNDEPHVRTARAALPPPAK